MRKTFVRTSTSLKFFIIMTTHIMLLHACTSIPESYRAEDAHIIHNVPFYPQKKYQCGPSSLASVLHYWGIEVTPEQIEDDIFSKGVRGTLTIDMVLYAQKKGLEANQYRGTLDMLKKHLDSYWPMIVLVDYGIYPIQMNHFLVVIGYSHDSLIVNSENKREQFIRKSDFMKIWRKTDYWTLLIKRKTYDEKT